MKTMRTMIFSARSFALGVFLVLVAATGAGCHSDGVDEKRGTGSTLKSGSDTVLGADILRPGDRVRVVYNDIPDKVEPAEMQVPDEGNLTLYLGVEAKFAGKKIIELEREIEAKYVVEKKLFRTITINIERVGLTVSVGGEVREPSNVPWVAGMSVVSAINAARGMTDYAAKGRVILTRTNGKTLKVDVGRAVDNPDMDQKIYPGDGIYVPRRGLGIGGL